MRHWKKPVLIFLLILWGAGICLAGNPVQDISLGVKEFSLKNGMLFIVVERPTTPQVACRLSIRAGSALEDTGKTGIAHLLEHMMFKGTKNFGTLDVQKDQELQAQIEAAYQVILSEERKRDPNQALIKEKLEEMDRLRQEVQKIYVPQAFSSQLGKNGAVGVNAFTSEDQTQYTTSVPSDMLEQWFSIISEQIFEPSWREFYVEKEVVKREWAFRYINNPTGALWLDLDALAYTAHPYHNPVIGWTSDMEKYNTQDAMEFYKRFYNPTNAVCVLVGDVSLDEAKRLAGIYFERYPAGNRAPESVTREPRQEGPRRGIRFLKGARTPLLGIGFHAAPMGTRDFYALDALTMVLSHGRGARMDQNIINKGLAVDAWAYNPDHRFAGMLVLGGSPNDPEELKRAGIAEEEKREVYTEACRSLEGILIAEAEKLKTERVSERDLMRIKKLNRSDFLRRIRSNEALAGTLATIEVQVGWRYLMEYLERIEEITPEDILRVANRYVREENKTVVYVIPGGRPEKPPEEYSEVRLVTGSAAAKLEKPDTLLNRSVYPTPTDWRHPLSFERRPHKIAYPKAEVENVEGATLFYMPDRELPIIDLTLLIKAGVIDVGVEKTGLDTLIEGALIRGGTSRLPPEEFALALDENAIELSIDVGEEASTLSLSVMKEDWDKGIGFLKEVLTSPRFDPQVLEVVKKQAGMALERQGGDARAVASREAQIWHFKGHPYGRDPIVGIRTIPGIGPGDLRNFLTTYMVPSNMVLAVSGDVEKAMAVEGLREVLATLVKERVPERELAYPKASPPVLALIHKPGQLQSQVQWIMPGPLRTQPDYWRMNLLMSIFGGSDSRVYKRLRDDLGLVYAAYFYQAFKWKAGMLMGYMGCKGDKTAQAIEETIRIMGELREKIDAQDLEQKRLDVLNSFVFTVDTPKELVEVYARYYLRHEPLDTLERIQDAYMEATEGELNELARRFLDPSIPQIFVVGDKTINVKTADGRGITLEEDLKDLAKRLDIPYTEIALR